MTIKCLISSYKQYFRNCLVWKNFIKAQLHQIVKLITFVRQKFKHLNKKSILKEGTKHKINSCGLHLYPSEAILFHKKNRFFQNNFEEKITLNC